MHNRLKTLRLCTSIFTKVKVKSQKEASGVHRFHAHQLTVQTRCNADSLMLKLYLSSTVQTHSYLTNMVEHPTPNPHTLAGKETSKLHPLYANLFLLTPACPSLNCSQNGDKVVARFLSPPPPQKKSQTFQMNDICLKYHHSYNHCG